jgi:RNA polymerase sigma-70 factor (ECF subfamily)
MPPSPRPPDSGELVARARAGDRDAFDDLLRRSEGRLLRMVRQRMGPLLRDNEASADLVQSVLRAAIGDLPRFQDRGPGSFHRWLTTLVEHKIAHRARDLQRECRDVRRREPGDAAELPILDPAASPSDVAVGNETERRYLAALARLGPEDQELVALHVELGCTYGDIAKALGIVSAEAVRKRLARALARVHDGMRTGTA